MTGLGLPTTTYNGQPFQSVIYLPLFGGGTVNVLGGSGGNTYNVQSTPVGTALTLTAGSGGDTINVGTPADPTQPSAATSSLAGIQGQLTVHGTGNTTLHVDDQGTTTDQMYNILNSQIYWGAVGTAYTDQLAYDGLATLTLDGSSAAYNILGVASTARGTHTIVNGHAAGNDQFMVMGLDYTLDGIQGNLDLHARPGSVYSFVEINDAGPYSTGSHTYRLSSPNPNQNQIERDGMATITYEGADEEIFTTPYRGGQVINIEGNAAAGPNFSAGIYTVVVAAGGDTVTVGRPNPNGPGRLVDQIQDYVDIRSYSDMGVPAITIDDSGDTAAKQVTLAASGAWYGISGLAPGVIYLNLSGGGTVSLLGGPGGDVFQVKDLPTFPITIQANAAASNTLDYSAYVGDVTVDLPLGFATGFTGISGIESVIGSQGNDILVGDANTLVLRGGTGRNLIIGGAAADRIFGGGGDNILIAGTTAYDTDLTALDAIMTEWAGAGSFSDRVSALSSPSFSYPLDLATVFADPVADSVTNGPGQNWVLGRNA
jgi:hypothetical protein